MSISSRVLLPLICACILLSFASSAVALPGDEFWASQWNRPGADDDVWDTVEFQSDLVAVGKFRFMGDVPANQVAIYDGTLWSALGQGFSGDVTCVAVYQNELYVGGFFTLADGTPIGNLARWTGSQWVTVDGGVDGYVNDLVTHDGELVVIGEFYTAGAGTSVQGIAGWNGASWNDFDGGIYDGYAYQGASDGTNLYLVGELYEVGSAFVNNVAGWNGSTWSSLGGGLTDDQFDPFGAGAEYCHVWNGNLVVTGYFLLAGGQNAENLALWNGSTWSAVGDPSEFADGAFAIGEYGGDLLVQDAYGITSRWNGVFWNFLSAGAFAFSIEPWGSNLVLAGGIFTHVNGVAAQNIAVFDGTSWSATTTGDGASKGVELLYDWNGTLVVGGRRTTYGPLQGSFVATWDGAQWSALGGPVTAPFGGSVNSATDYEGDLVIGGAFDTAGGVAANKIARFDGSSWSAMGGGSNAGVSALRVYQAELYAGMASTSGGGYQLGKWNGTSWDAAAPTNNGIHALAEYGGQLIVGGSFSTIDGNSISGLAAWDGTNWTAPGGGVTGGSVWALAVHNGKLYAAGQFTQAGGAPANRVAVFDGTNWAPLGDGVNNRVFGLVGHDGDIFATGEFLASGASPLSYVARWDGTGWDSMGSGLDGRGYSLGVYAGELFVGGDFGHAGAQAAVGISSWSSGATAVPMPSDRSTLALRSAGPNPFGERTALRFDIATSQDVLVSIHDLRGRRVQQQLLRRLPAGTNLFSWDGRDGFGRDVAAGTYFVRVVAGGQVASRTVTLVR